MLGLQRGASKKEVQQAFRELALKHHPDRDPSLQAAQRFQAVSRAATSILKEGSKAPASEAAAARRRWQEQHQSSSQQWVRAARTTRLPSLFISACLIGGCALFAGAVRVHHDMYSYNIATNADERRDNPTPAQQRINELLQEKRDQKQFDQH